MEYETAIELLCTKYNAEILRETDKPRSADELSDMLDIPIATTYRRIEELTNAGLLTPVSTEGQESTTYQRTIDQVSVSFATGAVELTDTKRSNSDINS